MKRFIEEYSNCRVIILKYNYRCRRNIVEAAGHLISHNINRIDKPIQSALSVNDYDDCSAKQDADVKNDSRLGEVIAEIFDNSSKEAEYVIGKIEELTSNEKFGYADICILYRSSHCASVIEERLAARKIPYIKRENVKSFYDRQDMKLIYNYLKIAVYQGTRAEYLEIINRPERGISREAFADYSSRDERPWEKLLMFYRNDESIRSVILKFRDDLFFLGRQPPYAAVNYLMYGMGLYDTLREVYTAEPYHGMEFDDFTEEIYERASVYDSVVEWLDAIDNPDPKSDSEDVKDDKGRIVLQTAHASKGLEYPVVFIIGMQEGLFPHNKSLYGDELEEERRLMYVAMTRAEEKLYICARGQTYGKLPSRFIAEI